MWSRPARNAPEDPATGKPVTQCHERVEFLLQTLQQEGAKIVIPTPALAEVLVRAEKAGPEFLQVMRVSRHLRISAFDERAAIEHAARQAARRRAGKATTVSRAKAKFDDQIVSIAKVEGASVIYSDDPDIHAIAGEDIVVRGIAELPLPPEDPQGALPFSSRDRP